MPQISGLLCQIITGKISGAGTDGDIFLGLCGREFVIDSKADDFERGNWREYILGDPPIPNGPTPSIHVNNPEFNDPRSEGFPLDSVNLDRSPVYLRFEPKARDDNWNLATAVILVYTDSFFKAFMPPSEFDNLWLGQKMGKVLFLTKEFVEGGDTPILKRVRELADKISKMPD